MADVKNFPILMYHHIMDLKTVPKKDWGTLYVDIFSFKKQMEYLKKSSYTFMDFDMLADALDGKAELPGKPVIIIVDDAYETTLKDILPIVKELDLKVVVALVTGIVDKLSRWGHYIVKENDILEMSRAGFSFESHSVTHPNFKEIELKLLESELKESKMYIENLLKKKITAIIYPGGAYDENVKKMCKEAGYRFGLNVGTSKKTVMEDLFEMRRIHIKRSDGMLAFRRKISKWYMWYRGIRESIRNKH